MPDDPARFATARSVARLLLGATFVFTGAAHLAWARQEFQAQVPAWVPLDADLVVVLSGVAELALGLALLILPQHRVLVGWLTAAFFVAIFPGNIAQFVNHDDAFGLDTDRARFIRLLFQPVLVAWALWSTDAWKAWRHRGELEVASSPSRRMGPIALARWQWSDYHLGHASRRNLLIHLVAVPLFVLGNLVFVAGLSFWLWLWADLGGDFWLDMPYVLGLLAISLVGLGISAGAIAWQGHGHRGETVPPKPFTGPGNALGRIFLEQWFTYWRFVLTGRWWRAWIAGR